MSKALEFSNFTLTFGPKFVLADFMNEIVIPAFTDKTLQRIYGRSTYLFIDTKLINLASPKDPEPAIVGTFVKDTVVGREQIFDAEKRALVADSMQIESAPSGTFVLLLANHKLLYLHETSYAPGISAFRSTAQTFLTRKYFSFIETEQVRRQARSEERVTKKSVTDDIPPPLLEIVPLSNEENLQEFVRHFKVLSAVTVQLSSVNSESDNSAFFRKMREQQKKTKAASSTLIERGGKDGLDKSEVVRQLKGAASEGNSQIKLTGFDAAGARLDRTSDDMKISVPMSNLPPDLPGKADALYRMFQKKIEDGSVKIAKEEDANTEKVIKKFQERG